MILRQNSSLVGPRPRLNARCCYPTCIVEGHHLNYLLALCIPVKAYKELPSRKTQRCLPLQTKVYEHMQLAPTGHILVTNNRRPLTVFMVFYVINLTSDKAKLGAKFVLLTITFKPFRNELSS